MRLPSNEAIVSDANDKAVKKYEAIVPIAQGTVLILTFRLIAIDASFIPFHALVLLSRIVPRRT